MRLLRFQAQSFTINISKLFVCNWKQSWTSWSHPRATIYFRKYDHEYPKNLRFSSIHNFIINLGWIRPYLVQELGKLKVNATALSYPWHLLVSLDCLLPSFLLFLPFVPSLPPYCGNKEEGCIFMRVTWSLIFVNCSLEMEGQGVVSTEWL